jgi:lamin tail-like protein
LSFKNILISAKLMKGIFIITIVLGVYTPLFSQWNDDFSDNEITSNPQWLGNINNFIVEGEILRLNAPSVTGSSYLATNSNISLEAEWSLFVKLDFNPSSSNYTKIYLMSDSANIDNTQNGYYIKIGGTADEISLYKVSNGSETTLIDGTDGRLSLSTVEISVNITRNSEGEWEVKSKLIDETEYTSEEKANDLEIQKSTYFGIFCKYTSTRSTKFYYDDISVTGSPYVDSDPPILVSSFTPNSKQLSLVFNEELDTLEAITIAHYVMNDTIVPKSATALSTDTLLLDFETDFELVNSLKIETLPDLAGNVLDTVVQVIFVDPSPYLYRDLVINEIYPDPNPQEDLPAFEFVELYNNSTRIIDVEGWQFTDGSKTATLDKALIFPDSFLIICSAEAEGAYQLYGRTIGLPNWPSLNNGGDSLTFTDKSGAIIDSLSYSLDWYNDESKDDGGWSLEQINPNGNCLGICNWSVSIQPGGGTPGKLNSVFDLGLDEESPLVTAISTPKANQIKLVLSEVVDTLEATDKSHFNLNNTIAPSSILLVAADTILLEFIDKLEIINTLEIIDLPDLAGNKLDSLIEVYYVDPSPHSYRDVVINEIFADPSPQEDLPLVEFIELLNNSDEAINLSGWQYSDGSKTFTFNNQLIYPDSFLILCPIEAKTAYQQFGETLGISTWPSLNNGGDKLMLTDRTGNIIDSLTYTLEWYRDTSKDNGGWSLEQINPNNECLGKCNWEASIDPTGGTPGKINSVFDLGLDEDAPVVVVASSPSITQVKLVFNKSVDTLEATGTSRYLLNNAINPSEIAISSSDTLTLNFNTNLTLENTLEIIGLPDMFGNKLDTLFQVYFIDPAPNNYREIVINEIFADPSPQEELPLFEFVEILNLSDRIIDLNGWEFTDGSKTAQFRNELLFPDSTLILCAEEAKEAYQLFGRAIGLSNWPSLNNGSDAIKLMDSNGVIIDSVLYSDKWYNNNLKNDGGWSLEQINPFSKCFGALNWSASNSIIGGTPGKTNSISNISTDADAPQIIQAIVTDSLLEVWFSEPVLPASYKTSISPNILKTTLQINKPTIFTATTLSKNLDLSVNYSIDIPLEDCSGNLGIASFPIIQIASPTKGEVVINEILFDPYTGGSDFVEIANTTSYYYNLKNYVMANESNAVTISDTTLILEPFKYVAFSENILFLKNQYLAPDSSLFKADLPTMPNDEGVIMLKSNEGIVIDSIFYSDEYHFSLISDVEGISLERISPSGESNNKNNWRSAAESVGYATPGYVNSQSFTYSQTGKITVSPEILTPNNDGQADFCQVIFDLDNKSQSISIRIYNLNGQLVKTLASNSLIPPRGFFTWDGTDHQGGILPTAHYIIVSETISSDGHTNVYRNKVVVANGF